ncbi:MAG TPA: hypothetical protein VJ851_17880 [Jatrophihabitans sp.]|nr:hypothetical protein [Jatrophihabitans sp.]
MNTVEERLRAALTAKSNAVSLADYRVELPEDEALLAFPDPHVLGRWPAAIAVAAAAVILLVVGVTVVAGRSNTHHLATAGRAEVPWSQVGPGWTLVVAVPADPATDPDLDLVSPSGVRYLICRLPAPFVELQPWTINTGKAIVAAKGASTIDGVEHDIKDVLIVDLHTGAQTRTSVGSKFSTVQFASSGLDSLLVTYPTSMQLVSAGTGHTVARYPLEGLVLGSTLSPDGSQVVAGGLTGLVVFDRASGRRTDTLATPAGYGPCQLLRWVPASDEILAECFTRNRSVPNQDFIFAADGQRAPQPDSVPAGWQGIRLAGGTVAFQQVGFSYPGPLSIKFAQVASGGRLLPLAVPAELEQGRWELAAVSGNALLFDQRQGLLNNQDVLQLAAWNPLTGSFTLLLRGDEQQPTALSHTSWQQYSPPTLP